jgi:hypothetical protein
VVGTKVGTALLAVNDLRQGLNQDAGNIGMLAAQLVLGTHRISNFSCQSPFHTGLDKFRQDLSTLRTHLIPRPR